MTEKERVLLESARLILQSRHLVALVGAGMSVESGIPPFRGPGGLWTRIGEPPMSGYQRFLQDPKRWWEERLEPPAGPIAEFAAKMENARPNPGHYALAELERFGILKHIITQNVDGLHHRAGSQKVAEIHGSRFKMRCIECTARFPREEIPLTVLPPRCPTCGGVMKSDGVMFGEPIPADVLALCQEQTYLCDSMMVVGTSALVFPAAGFALTAREQGAALIEFNTADTPLTPYCSVVLRGPSGQLLPEIVQRVKQLMDSQ